MKKNISVVRTFLVGTGVLGAISVAWSCVLIAQNASRFSWVAPLNSPWSAFSLILFIVLATVAARFVILVPGEEGQAATRDLGTVGVLAAIVVFPVYLALVIVAVSFTATQLALRPTARRRAWQFSVFNIGNMTLSAGASALVFRLLNGRQILMHPSFPGQGWQLVLAVGGAVSTNYVLSYGLFVTSLWLIQRAFARRNPSTVVAKRRLASISIRDIFAQSHRNTILPEATAAIVGLLFGYLWLVNPPLAPIALLPLAVIYIAFKNFIRLQELDRLKSNFITEVSHELRTPLSAILASSELLYHHAAELEPESLKDLSRSSYESSNHLFRVVENLLNASTIQSGTLTVKPTAVSIDEMVSDAITQVQPFIDSKQQSVNVELPADLPEVLADPRHIVQVLINLLTNASKYSATSTKICISSASEGDHVRVSVTDEGMGIPTEEMSHIFDRFYRVPSNTMTSVVGSGLGLTIVKSLVEMHDGRVGVSSSVGKGSTFWFTLPQSVMATV